MSQYTTATFGSIATSSLNLKNGKISNVGLPSAATDVATKAYVLSQCGTNTGQLAAGSGITVANGVISVSSAASSVVTLPSLTSVTTTGLVATNVTSTGLLATNVTFAASTVTSLLVTGAEYKTGYQYLSTSTGATVNIAGSTRALFVDSTAGAMSALTIALPSAPVNGQRVDINIDAGVTTLTLTNGTFAGGSTPSTTYAAGTALRFAYHTASTKWWAV